jgi:membrane protein involved in colicin uptake
MSIVKKALQAVSKELKSLAKQTDKLIKAVDKLEKGQGAKKAKTTAKATAKATAKTTRKAPAKKAAGKPAESTATDQVLGIIMRSKDGVDVPTLVKKTGLEEKQIRNIVFRAFKQERIKRAGRGSYVRA